MFMLIPASLSVCFIPILLTYLLMALNGLFRVMNKEVMLPLCCFVASRYCLEQFSEQIVKSFGYVWNFISPIWFLGPEVFRMSPILSHTFSDRSRFLMSNADNISLHIWSHNNTNRVASFWFNYFKLVMPISKMYVITVVTSHVKLYFGRAGLMLKTPFINLVMTGCWPTGTPSILRNIDSFFILYPTPLWNKSYKNNKIWFIVVS